MSNHISKTKEYRAWAHAKARCLNPSDPRYKVYGARGISMHLEWVGSFKSFLGYIGYAPTPSHTLERIDNKKGYEPGNVKWATRDEQVNNKTNSVKVTIDGFSGTLKQLADYKGLVYKSLWHYFVGRGLDLSVAINQATKIGQERKRGQDRFCTADMTPILSKSAISRWRNGGVKAWGR